MDGETCKCNRIPRPHELSRAYGNVFGALDHIESKFRSKQVKSWPHIAIDIEKDVETASSVEKSDFVKIRRCKYRKPNGRKQVLTRTKKDFYQLSYSKPFTKCRRNRLHPLVETPVPSPSGRAKASPKNNEMSIGQMYRQLDALSRECVDLSRARNKNVDGIPLLICIIMLIIAALLVYLVIEKFATPPGIANMTTTNTSGTRRSSIGVSDSIFTAQ
jgi:hypothetical protein